MRLRLYFIAITFFLSYAVKAQIFVDNTLTAKQLVEEFLIGDGLQVDNITINGYSDETVNSQAGLYTGPSNVIDFPEGIVMVSGNAKTVMGVLSGGLTHETSNDPDLKAISGQSIKHAIVIEFDFLATSDSIQFNYVFASKEYPDFTCSSFNDAFGFFLSGPGIEGPFSNNSKNIALIPGTEIPVAINTVNSGVASFGFSDSTCAAANPDWIAHSQYFVNNANQPAGDVQFPGMTQTFTAQSKVQCGEWYHIKLAVGDASDGNLDSGVFLESGSFTAFGEVYLSVVPQIDGDVVDNPSYQDVLIAGCSEAYIELTRSPGMFTDSVFVKFGGTAVEGVDYILGENDTLFFFPEGVDTIGFTITTLWDEVPDENKNIVIMVWYGDGCGEMSSNSVTMDIVDPYEINALVESVFLTCPTDQVLIAAQGIGGIEPYKYDWGDQGAGENLSEIWVDVPPDSMYYPVAISDVCDFEDKRLDSVLVVNNIPDPLRAIIEPYLDPECPNEAIDLQAAIQDGNGEYNITWTDGKGRQHLPRKDITVPGANGEIIYFMPEPQNFIEILPVYLAVVDSCGTTVRDTVYVNYPFVAPLYAQFNPINDHCPSEPIVLQAQTSGGQNDFDYQWSITNGVFGDGADPNSDHIHVVPAAGANEYTLSVRDYCGRIGADYEYMDDQGNVKWSGHAVYTDTLQVIDLENIMNIITPNGDGKNDFFVVNGVHEFEDVRLEVYDRWGKMIFKSDKYRAGDIAKERPSGAFDAEGFADGAYFYVIDVNKGECVQSGTIEVLRGN